MDAAEMTHEEREKAMSIPQVPSGFDHESFPR
jgi:hypothetical protein